MTVPVVARQQYLVSYRVRCHVHTRGTVAKTFPHADITAGAILPHCFRALCNCDITLHAEAKDVCRRWQRRGSDRARREAKVEGGVRQIPPVAK
jgi:hypothetical protein